MPRNPILGDSKSPTVERSSPKIVLPIAQISPIELEICDISDAFTQSHLLPKSERIILFLPFYLETNWKGRIPTDRPKVENRSQRMPAIKQLYGTTDAPLRWFARGSNAFKTKKTAPMFGRSVCISIQRQRCNRGFGSHPCG